VLRQWTPLEKYFKYLRNIETACNTFVCHYSWDDLVKFSENPSNLPTQ